MGSCFGPIGAGVGMYLGHLADGPGTTGESEAVSLQQDQRPFLMEALVGVAIVDGPMNAREANCLHRFTAEIYEELPPSEQEALLRRYQGIALTVDSSAQVVTEFAPEFGMRFARMVLTMIHCDGAACESEIQWFTRFVELAELPPDECALLVELFARRLPVREDTAEALAILELTTTATPQEIRDQYRKLAGQYHPDRQSGASAAVRAEAEEIMKSINLAYSKLTKADSETPMPMVGLGTNKSGLKWDADLLQRSVVKCFLCGQENRLPAREKMIHARCGCCFALLLQPPELGEALQNAGGDE